MQPHALATIGRLWQAARNRAECVIMSHNIPNLECVPIFGKADNTRDFNDLQAMAKTSMISMSCERKNPALLPSALACPRIQ
jgi:hypothetical protein